MGGFVKSYTPWSKHIGNVLPSDQRTDERNSLKVAIYVPQSRFPIKRYNPRASREQPFERFGMIFTGLSMGTGFLDAARTLGYSI